MSLIGTLIIIYILLVDTLALAGVVPAGVRRWAMFVDRHGTYTN